MNLTGFEEIELLYVVVEEEYVKVCKIIIRIYFLFYLIDI